MSSQHSSGAGWPDAQTTLRRAGAGLAAAWAMLAAAPPVAAVIIDSGDGTANTSAPADDPGWGHMLEYGLTGTYIGNGWVLTANHTGLPSVVSMHGVLYDTVPGSRVRLQNGPEIPGNDPPDVAVFQIEGNPELPDLPILPIRGTTPPVGTDVIMIGRGKNRGAALQWMGLDGWYWLGSNAMRWGTNRVADNLIDVAVSGTTTRSLQMDFDAGLPTADESQVATGDSGGALFIKNDTTLEWELAGVLFTRTAFVGQPANTAIHGNSTFAVDLAYYRDQIIALTRPECSDEVDNDGDGAIDFPDDAGCHAADGLSELPDCDDDLDNDADGLFDYPADPGCRNRLDASREDPECSDGEDNDLDSWIDFGQDPECNSAWDEDESSNPPACGLLGIESALVVAAALARRGRRRGTAATS